MSARERPRARRVEAVERAIAVLDSLAEAAELGTNEIARRTEINASSVSRLLATLAAAGLVDQVDETGRYRLGLRLVELGNAALARIDLRELARPHLRTLVETTGETATLSVPGERDAITIDFVQSPLSVQSVARLGRPSVGHATATGKVMLAFGPAALPGRLERFTARTITDPKTLQRELDRVRARGYAEANEEREPGLAAIAAPVRGRTGELVAVLGVQGPSDRFRGTVLRAAVAPLRDTTAALSRALGFAPP